MRLDPDLHKAGEGHVNLPWVEKYRPNTLSDLVSQKEIVNAVTKMIDQDRLPHLLFYGPPGTGKTSTILAAAKKIFTPKSMQSRVLELNASDERGIGVVREKIVNFASSQGLYDMISATEGKKQIKLVILDEADAMTKDAQNALRRIIEKYTDSTRFCIICNYLSKIIPALQSRCTRFRFAPLKEKHIASRLDHVIKQENLNVTDDGKKALFKLSKGDMRRIINILQSTALSSNVINEDSVYSCVGYPHPNVVKDIFKILMDNTIEIAEKKITNIRLTQAIALADILDGLLDLIREVDISDKVLALLCDQLAQIEIRLSIGCSEKIQTLALISAFIQARYYIFDDAKEVNMDD